MSLVLRLTSSIKATGYPCFCDKRCYVWGGANTATICSLFAIKRGSKANICACFFLIKGGNNTIYRMSMGDNLTAACPCFYCKRG